MVGIEAIEYVLPDKILTNDELALQFNGWTSEKIYDKTGIKTRHVVEHETAMDLAVKAVNQLLGNYEVDKCSINFIIYVTQSPEYILPSTSCVLQERLGFDKQIGALDVNLGCSGYVYGLALAKGLIHSELVENVLLVTADTYSKYLHQKDRSVRTIFGDAATATLIGTKGLEIGNFDFGTDGGEKDLLIVPAGGMRYPCSDLSKIEKMVDGNIRTDENLYMDGPGIFDFTIREVPQSIERIFEKEGLSKENIDLYIFHQANGFILNYLRKIMNIEEEHFYMKFSDIGNTVSSSIPIALKRAMEEGKIQSANNILLSGFGTGLSWATTIIKGGK